MCTDAAQATEIHFKLPGGVFPGPNGPPLDASQGTSYGCPMGTFTPHQKEALEPLAQLSAARAGAIQEALKQLTAYPVALQLALFAQDALDGAKGSGRYQAG